MYDNNYHETFAAVRDHMNRMKEVALKYKAVDESRDEEFRTNGRSTLFDILNERGMAFSKEFDTINAAAHMLISQYGNQVSDKKLEHSQAWHEINEELHSYASVGALLPKL